MNGAFSVQLDDVCIIVDDLRVCGMEITTHPALGKARKRLRVTKAKPRSTTSVSLSHSLSDSEISTSVSFGESVRYGNHTFFEILPSIYKLRI